jgi:hypothetical protein
MNSVVTALTQFDDGPGAALYARGSFTSAGGVVAIHVAKWNETQWSPLAPRISFDVNGLAVFDEETALLFMPVKVPPISAASPNGTARRRGRALHRPMG